MVANINAGSSSSIEDVPSNEDHTGRLTVSNAVKKDDKRRVLIVENNSVLGAALESALTREAELTLSGIVPNSQGELLAEIGALQPDVIIMHQNYVLANQVELRTLLDVNPHLCLIVLSENESTAHIYTRWESQIRRTTDLVEVIRGRGNQPATR